MSRQNNIFWIITVLIFHSQNDVVGCAHQVEALESQFAARMEALKNTVQSKTAVPTAQVYVSTFCIMLFISQAYKLYLAFIHLKSDVKEKTGIVLCQPILCRRLFNFFQRQRDLLN